MLADSFGAGFNDKPIPGTRRNAEAIDKKRVLDGLRMAKRESKKGEYGKGAQSADLPGRVDPVRLRDAAPHFRKLLTALGARLPC